jgi:uncharacterized protein YmfQ (DUF2313 family)
MKKKIKAAWQEMYARFADVFGYTVYSKEYDKCHYCFSMKEALSWMRCYNGSIVINGFRIVASNRRVA